MKYFLDTKHHEYKKQPTVCGIKVGKPIDTIELIGIGLVSEGEVIPDNTKQIGLQNGSLKLSEVIKGDTSKEYYAICKDFDLKAAWNNERLRENVLKPMHEELKEKEYGGSITRHFTYNNFKWLINEYGKTREQIAEEIKYFVADKEAPIRNTTGYKYPKPEFYAYYSSYDWVVFCWLFGRMIDLPTGFPMYCFDLKQELERLNETLGYNVEPSYKLQEHKEYPKQTNEHNALADAKWNKRLYNFISRS